MPVIPPDEMRQKRLPLGQHFMTVNFSNPASNADWFFTNQVRSFVGIGSHETATNGIGVAINTGDGDGSATVTSGGISGRNAVIFGR